MSTGFYDILRLVLGWKNISAAHVVTALTRALSIRSNAVSMSRRPNAVSMSRRPNAASMTKGID